MDIRRPHKVSKNVFNNSNSNSQWAYFSQFLLLTATMSSALDKVVEFFPHPTVQPIVGQPSYETIAELELKLNTNAASVHSNRGDGKLGLLFLTVKPAVYNTQSMAPFTPPTNPGQNPTIAAGSTGPQISEIRRQHKELMEDFNQYLQTDRALKGILIAAVDEAYIRSLWDK